ncbi:DUF6193 family natural product biosynthesis protein [Amycolatopsis plumensis]|uniref:DUF6193 family natural product biosynthesis protein n=1 Tax=Amycolatopsis plumensis TaxID=236508 RepID=A0ABV5U3I8_9PSEU
MGESPYQDLVDAGGLEAVLRAACPGCDIEMPEARGAFGGFLARVGKGDRVVEVLPLVDERLFRVRHLLRGRYLSRLFTTDLAEVTGVAAAWLGGATARELAAAWPFADFADIADAFESGDRTELAWQFLRTHDGLRLGEFVEAAMREPRLRRMYPVTSVMMMSFQPAADERRVPGLWVRAAGGGRVTVFTKGRWEEPDTYDAAEAVRACLAEIDRLGEWTRSGSSHPTRP